MALDKLTLKEIQHFGGTKEDLELLDGVDEDGDEEMVFGDSEVDKKYRQEVQSFIESLGLNTSPTKNDKSKKKLMDGQSKKIAKEPSISYMEEGDKAHPVLEKKLLALSAKTQKKMLVSIDSDQLWYDQSNSMGTADPVSPRMVAHLTRVGEELMTTEMSLYEKARQKRKSAGDLKWLKTVLSSGTLSDKIAARTLLIQESPIHTLPSLDTLLTMASKKGKRECILAVDALKELWLTVLLPDNRKLKTLKQRPLSELVSADQSLHSRHTKLLLWYYEDQLKTKYAQFLSVIKGLLHDTVGNIREKALGHVFDLLYHKPEQEQELLSQLVNKLGDPVRKIASKASLFLLKLLNQHVNMKVVVATELEKLLHRPNIRPKAQYYCVCCLNQFTIAGRDDALAAKLVEIYFTFFKLYVDRGELDAKMLGALLTGVNRAFPFLKDDIPSFEDHLQSLFTVVHIGPLATGIQSLLLLYQVMESRQAISGRYYQALYTKLMDPALKHSGKQGIFLNLLFKSVKNDPEIKRVKAFLKRILQVASFHSPPFLCGCLYLISEVLKVRPSLWPFILQPGASDMEHFVDIPLPIELDTEDNEHMTTSPDHMTERSSHVFKGSLYKMMQRNPLYCGAESSCLWELCRLTQHFHPSVQVFAKSISSGEHIDYKGDPLQDFTAMHFLDRFVYKNPKQRESDHGGSLMQRSSRLLPDKTRSKAPVNSAQFAALKPDKVREDELFMHTYFTQRAALGREVAKDKKKSVDEDESGSEMDFAGELEKQATNKRQPKRSRESGSERESFEDSDFDDDDSLMGVASDAGDDGEVGEMERLLLDNMSSDSGEELEEGLQRKKQRDSQFSRGGDDKDMSSLFAAAEEFSHLLEEGAPAQTRTQMKGGGAHKKQLQWEQRNTRQRKGKGHSRTGKRTVSHKRNRKRKRV